METLEALTVEEVRQKLRLGRSTVYKLIASGEIRVSRAGRAIRVPVDALRDWLKQETQAEGQL